MILSPEGRSKIEQREGVKYVVYLDSAGNKTAGMGHLLPSATPLAVGDKVTKEQVDAWATQDLAIASAAVNSLVKIALTQNQFDALVSFVFNVGVAAFTTSTLLKLLNKGDYTGAQAEFVKWHYETKNGVKKTNGGLLNRRIAEAAQFGGQSPAAASLPIALEVPVKTAPPPNKVTQTTTGKLQVGAVVTGGAAAALGGINQAIPVVQGVQQVSSLMFGMPPWLAITCAILIAACLGASIATLVHKKKSM